MMYCAVNEAFDNPLKHQIMEYENNNNKGKQELCNSVNKYHQDNQLSPPYNNNSNNNLDPDFDPGSFDTYNEDHRDYQDPYNAYDQNDLDLQYQQNYKESMDDPYLSFFTAQGDLNNNGTYNDPSVFGTTINDLKQMRQAREFVESEDDTLSLLDSYSPDFSLSNDLSRDLSRDLSKDLDNKPSRLPKNKVDHAYCINKFVDQILDENIDIVSMTSSQNSEIYDHIKKCKYCRDQINKKLKSYYKPQKKVESFKPAIFDDILSNGKILGYDLKEIVVVIIFGIIIIFILDLLVRVGRASSMSVSNK